MESGTVARGYAITFCVKLGDSGMEAYTFYLIMTNSQSLYEQLYENFSY